LDLRTRKSGQSGFPAEGFPLRPLRDAFPVIAGHVRSSLVMRHSPYLVFQKDKKSINSFACEKNHKFELAGFWAGG
jgi:hypothetical protein